ncbi:MAG: hypothetical protein Q9219_004509 [cf. Caloplaca sp. 3 TL-2023]
MSDKTPAIEFKFDRSEIYKFTGWKENLRDGYPFTLGVDVTKYDLPTQRLISEHLRSDYDKIYELEMLFRRLVLVPLDLYKKLPTVQKPYALRFHEEDNASYHGNRLLIRGRPEDSSTHRELRDIAADLSNVDMETLDKVGNRSRQDQQHCLDELEKLLPTSRDLPYSGELRPGKNTPRQSISEIWNGN